MISTEISWHRQCTKAETSGDSGLVTVIYSHYFFQLQQHSLSVGFIQFGCFHDVFSVLQRIDNIIHPVTAKLADRLDCRLHVGREICRVIVNHLSDLWGFSRYSLERISIRRLLVRLNAKFSISPVYSFSGAASALITSFTLRS